MIFECMPFHHLSKRSQNTKICGIGLFVLKTNLGANADIAACERAIFSKLNYFCLLEKHKETHNSYIIDNFSTPIARCS